MIASPRAIQLILDFEIGGGEGVYNQRYRRPVWPREASGVTIGVGYDLGYVTPEQFETDWKELPPTDRELLASVVGLKGPAARDALSRVQSVDIPWPVAYRVFVERTLPRYWDATLRVFPGVERLPADTQGALLSLVLNRGASLAGDRRREMLQIRDAILAHQEWKIPGLIRAMTRIWVGTPIENGMRRRREAEAQLAADGLASAMRPLVGEERRPDLPALGRLLRLGSRGDDVRALQAALAFQGYDVGPLDGDFGPRTASAVRAFQAKAGLTVDGVVGRMTWSALDGFVGEEVNHLQGGSAERRLRMAEVAEQEAGKGLRWTGPDSEAEKYLAPLRGPMQAVGHIGSQPVFFDWCSAFVTYCAREAGFTVPDQPPGYFATMALAEAWRHWGQDTDSWHERDNITPERGDVVCFEWRDGDRQIDHVGIVRGYEPGSSLILTSEGNVGNQAQNRTRPLSSVRGFVRLVQA